MDDAPCAGTKMVVDGHYDAPSTTPRSGLGIDAIQSRAQQGTRPICAAARG